MPLCPAAPGAYLWAFALVHLEQAKHQQMIPRLWMPRPRPMPGRSRSLLQHAGSIECWLAPSCSAFRASTPAGFWWAGWRFSCPWRCAPDRRLGQTLRFVKENRRRVTLIVGLWIALHLAAFVPYMVVNADISRSYGSNPAGLMPTPAAWLTGPVGMCWDQTLAPAPVIPPNPPPAGGRGCRMSAISSADLASSLMLAASAASLHRSSAGSAAEFALARAGPSRHSSGPS